MLKEEKVKLNLPCILTEEEMKDYSRSLAKAIEEKAHLEDAKKTVASQYKSDIEAQQATINSLAGKISSGKEWRDVECIVEYNWKEGYKTFIRADTGESLNKREPIQAHERQVYIGGDSARNGNG